jgi:prepilin-type N-terminal cleavage/methylation domain-containing protein
MRREQQIPRSPGFTLPELLIVMVIVAILLSFILTVAMDGIRRAEERATQALIEKLDNAMQDRITALLSNRVDPTQAHNDIGAIYYTYGTNTNSFPPTDATTGLIPPSQRSQVIALYDYIKAEVPDVFSVFPTVGTATPPNYPLNFAANPFPSGTTADLNYAVPIDYISETTSTNFTYTRNPPTGMYGASFTAAGALFQLLGYAAQGYNGADDNQNGLIDEWSEGATGLSAALQSNLAAHQHRTARSEMLYALLVKGQGPLGSAFDADDFTPREVQDTDGDGLPEFVDAWGNPLRFYRWPIYYNDDVQQGVNAYATPFATRQQSPLDPNQNLAALAWWLSSANIGTPGGFAAGTTNAYSGGAMAFMNYFSGANTAGTFGALVDPTGGMTWDRGQSVRRAYYFRFLIASAGQDGVLGISELAGASTSLTTANLLEESAATPVYPLPSFLLSNYQPIDPTNPYVGADDITNHNLQATGGGF